MHIKEKNMEVRMKSRKLRKVNPVTWLLLTSLVMSVGWLSKPQTRVTAQVKPPFVIRNYGGKCMEFGVPRRPVDTVWTSVPVFISDCNSKTTQQQIRIEELTNPTGHLVILRVGDRVLGKKLDSGPVLDKASKTAPGAAATDSTAVEAASAPDQTPLEAQPYTNPPLPGQIFALDGDSIILAEDRNLVVEVKNGRGANRTPLVLGTRNLDDSEFWTFTPTDGSGWRPTTGFRRVWEADQLASMLPEVPLSDKDRAQPGTVIEIDPWVRIHLTGLVLRVPPGVTIRGGRRGLIPGAELFTFTPATWTMLTVDGADVRITGLRLSGPTLSTNSDAPDSRGIHARSDLHKRVILDHNELSLWTNEAIDVWGDGEQPEVCSDFGNPKDSGLPNVRVARNFIHHNRKQNKGYGVEAHYGGFPLIEGNTFLQNRHAIMADGKACTKYLAWRNLVLSQAPWQEKLGIPIWHTHDFDVHGTGDNGMGGRAGHFFEIAWNTFLGDNRENFDLRGEPTVAVEYHHNISLMDLEDAVACSYCGDGINKLHVYDNNQFDVSNPTKRFGVGDFDGDGVDDLFLATGAAWYYAPAGKAEWRFINAKTEKIGDLLFGDFDADGRTDVFTLHGANWEVSWGGSSKWEKINESADPIGDYHVGDFIGDGRADVFYANGIEWYFSDGGVGPLTPLTTSSFRIPDLRFGDFNADGKTDVFSVVTGKWQVSYSGTSAWTPLGPDDTGSVADLIVADFDGDGRADVATSNWKVSYSGTSSWTTLRDADQSLSEAVAIGRFDNAVGSDVLLWHPNTDVKYLLVSGGGTGDLVRHSDQDMR